MIFKTEEEKFNQYVDKFIKNNVPEQYNQIALTRELLNQDIDHYISISNRSDGKSFNYIHFFMNLAIDYNLKFMLLCRKYTVRDSYQALLLKIADKSKILNSEKLVFVSTQHYQGVVYNNEMIGIITDLNSATNLKYLSNFLSDYPLMIYDEFLAIQGDYLPDEWEKLKTIYSSVNRDFDLPLIKFPKIFYLGNAVNFSSPILSQLKLFNHLENHPINTLKQYGNIMLEMRKNENSNNERNLRAFNEWEDNLTSGQFTINDYQIASDDDRKEMLKNRVEIVIKLDDQFLKVDYQQQTKKIILSILGYAEDYDFNLLIVDNKETSVFLKDSFYSENEIKKHNKGYYLYDNAYSKEFFLSNHNYMQLNIRKIIKYYLGNAQEKEKEAITKTNEIDEIKRHLVKRFEWW